MSWDRSERMSAADWIPDSLTQTTSDPMSPRSRTDVCMSVTNVARSRLLIADDREPATVQRTEFLFAVHFHKHAEAEFIGKGLEFMQQ